ncbi:MAG: hypothetical protein H8D26_04690 [Methanomicrobia archaeon]|nr:hypothetical protein [Methanomicrobia archaeon]
MEEKELKRSEINRLKGAHSLWEFYGEHVRDDEFVCGYKKHFDIPWYHHINIVEDVEEVSKETKIKVTHIPYSKSIRIKYNTEEEAEEVLSILKENGINWNKHEYTG